MTVSQRIMREEYAACRPRRGAEPDALKAGDRRPARTPRADRLCCSIAAGSRPRCSAGSARGTMDCPNCSVSLVVHGEGPSRRAQLPLLQLFGARPTAAVRSVPAPYLEQAGFGTERVEAGDQAAVAGCARRAAWTATPSAGKAIAGGAAHADSAHGRDRHCSSALR